MTFRTVLLSLAIVAVAGCGGDDATAVTSGPSDQELEVRRLEAEARIAEANARASDDAPASTSASDAEASDAEAADVARAPASTPETSRSSGSATSGSASTRPGLTGLPPATASDTYTTLVDGTRPFRFCQTYRQSAVSRYEGMELCYTGTVRQEGTTIIGSGEKDTENGRTLSGAARTDMRIEGYLYNDLTLRFNFTDQGARRVARGAASFPEAGYDGGCEGHGWRDATFQTDAANSSGSATFFVEQNCGV